VALSRIHHVCFDVKDIEAVENLLSGIFGFASSGISTMPLDGGKGSVKTAFFRFDEGCIELACHDFPDSWRDSPLNRGEGFHHIGFETNSLEDALEELRAGGVDCVEPFPMTTPHGRIAFLDPSHTGGILMELRERKDK
jgi:catechol 2,3-dioxygenase-like lactoylglutathione lyase family enzyme